MKITIPFLMFLILAISQSLYSQDETLSSLLPDNDTLEGLIRTSEIESYVGDDLFSLINGGADLYFEYGFVQVISADYANREGNSLHVEIYEMSDRSAAFGIYSFQQMSDDKPDEIGERGQIVKNNALLIKDRFVIKMSAKFPDDKVEDVLKTSAGLITSRITVGDFKPLMLPYLLPVQDNDFPQVKFIRGSIALRNIYNFHNEDIFKFNDGVVGVYQEYVIFIFQYPGSFKALQQFGVARSQLEISDRYSSYYSHRNQFQMVDKRGNKVHCLTFDKFIIVFIYQGNRNLTPFIEEIKYNIELTY